MILVTGATCPTGQEVVRLLRAEVGNAPIRCLTRRTPQGGKTDLEWFTGDLADPNRLSAAFDGIQDVIHIAGIHWSLAIAREASNRKCVNRVIYVHTTSRYAQHKAAAQSYVKIEEDAKASGTAYTILRPSMVYGDLHDRNISRLIDFLFTHRFFPVFGMGRNLFQPVHYSDLAKAIVDIYKDNTISLNRAYNLPGCEPITYREMLQFICSNLPHHARLVPIPIALALPAAHIYAALSKKPMISVEQVKGMRTDRAYDYSDASRDFGYSPRGFKEGVLPEIESFLTLKRTAIGSSLEDQKGAIT